MIRTRMKQKTVGEDTLQNSTHSWQVQCTENNIKSYTMHFWESGLGARISQGSTSISKSKGASGRPQPSATHHPLEITVGNRIHVNWRASAPWCRSTQCPGQMECQCHRLWDSSFLLHGKNFDSLSEEHISKPESLSELQGYESFSQIAPTRMAYSGFTSRSIRCFPNSSGNNPPELLLKIPIASSPSKDRRWILG